MLALLPVVCALGLLELPAGSSLVALPAAAASREALERDGLRVTHVLPDGTLVALAAEGSPLPAAARPLDPLLAPRAEATLPLEGDAVARGELEGETDAGDSPVPSSSLVLAGDVVLGLALPESTGAAEPDEETWTAADVDAAVTAAVAGTLRLALAPGAPRLTFVVELLSAPPPGGVPGTVACAYEARRHSNFDVPTDGSWLGALGYAGDVMEARLRLAADLRARHGADAAYLAKVVRDRVLGPGRATAILGGPQVTWFLSSPPFVVAHESAHAFGALDEYCPDACRSPSLLAGVAQAPNANSRANDGTGYFAGAGEGRPCLMLGDVERVCAHTRSQLGWDDADGDGAVDAADLEPTSRLAPADVSAEGVLVAGDAWVLADAGSPAPVLDRIAGVEVRVARGAWLEAWAADGAFDSPAEPFRVLLPPLPDGAYAVEARARTRSGNRERRPALLALEVAGSSALDAAPHARLDARPLRARAGTEVTLDASLSSDLEGSPLEARFDLDGDGSFDTGWGATRALARFDAAGRHEARVELRDGAGNVSVATVPVEATADDLPPVLPLEAAGAGLYGAPEATLAADASRAFDPEGSPLELRYRFGAAPEGAWTSEPWSAGRAPVSPSDAIVVAVTARDAGGRTAVATRALRAVSYDHPPAAALALRPGSAPGEVVLDASSSADPDAGEPWEGALRFRFDLDGDGRFDTPWGTFASLAHAFPDGRATLAAVEVRDRFLATARAELLVDRRTAPVFPEGVALEATAGPCGVVLAWRAAVAGSGPPSYRVERARDGGAWEPIGRSGRATFVDAAPPAGARVAYRIRAEAPGDPPLADANGEQVEVDVPPDALRLHAVRASGGASLSWTGGAARVLARASAAGDEQEVALGSGSALAPATGAIVYYRVVPDCR